MSALLHKHDEIYYHLVPNLFCVAICDTPHKSIEILKNNLKEITEVVRIRVMHSFPSCSARKYCSNPS